jgi:RNA polymerase sigma-70 factor (ECF subfamily)
MLGDGRTRELVDAYVDAFARGDVDAVAALLAEDAVFSLPPWASWWRGRETIASFARTAVELCPEVRTMPIRANGQAAVADYALDAETGRYLASAIDVFTFEGPLISEITAFVTPEIFARFGLPAELAP